MINNPDIIHIVINPQSDDLVTIDPTNHPMRPAFINSISFFCTPEEFELIGMNLLLDQELFNRFVLFSNTKANTAEMDAWWKNALNEAISSFNLSNVKTTETETIMSTSNTPAPELNVTMDDTGTANAIDPRDIELLKLRAELLRRDNEVIREELLKQAKKPAFDKAEAYRQKEAKEKESVKESSNKDFDWIDLGKTVGIAAAGAAVGAVSMWAFKKLL